MAIVRGFEFPDDLFYLVEHDTWVRLDADGVATVGITALGAHISGQFIEFMPKPLGTAIDRERALGMLEMSKVIRSVRAPISGIVVEVNERVKIEPGLINTVPYGEGWLVRMRPAAWQLEARALVTEAAIPAAVESYMGLLSDNFGTSLP